MKHRIKRLVSMILVLMMGLGMKMSWQKKRNLLLRLRFPFSFRRMQTAIAEVAVLSDDDGKLSATLVLYWKDTQAKIDEIVFGHADTTPTNPQPNQPTPSSPSRPSSSTKQILGAESNSWFMPLLVLAGGIAILFVALVAKRRKGGNR